MTLINTYLQKINTIKAAAIVILLCLLSFSTIAGDFEPMKRQNVMGVNLTAYGGVGGDYTPEKPWADAMRSHRFWCKSSSSITAADAPLDENGWPTEDAKVRVYHGLTTANNHGTYKIYFECENPAGVYVTTEDGYIENQSYSGKQVACDLVITDDQHSAQVLYFTDTNGGVRNVKLMRPISPGSTTSYSPDRLFTDQFIAAVEPFKVLRCVHWMRTTVPGCDSLWSKRTKWTYATQQPKNPYSNNWGKSQPPWESIIKFANATGKDVWINTPIRANDEYLTNLAKLFKEGNDDCEPLNPELKLYIEYANEVWNSGYGKQMTWIYSQLDNHPELVFDGTTDRLLKYWRYSGMRTVQISDIFRSVFGDDQMMTRIRPVLCHWKGQYSVVQKCMRFIDKYYNKMDSQSDYSDPHPINHYLYAYCSSTYWKQKMQMPELTIENIWESEGWIAANHYEEIKESSTIAKMYGLSFIGYEGGPHQHGNNTEVLKDACVDPRMRDKQAEMQRMFNQVDGEINILYTLIGSPSGPIDILRQDIGNLDRPRYQSILDINQNEPDDITVGSVAPFKRDGRDFDMSVSGTGGAGSLNLIADNVTWSTPYTTAYCFQVEEAGSYDLVIEYSTTQAATLVVEYAGNVVETLDLSSTGGEVQTTSAMNISCESDKLYAIRLAAKTGTVTIKSLALDIATSSIDLENKSGFENNLKIYPCPAQDMINIELYSSTFANATITIYDIIGNKVLNQDHKVNLGDNRFNLSSQMLKDGLYTVQVKQNNNTSINKILIEK